MGLEVTGEVNPSSEACQHVGHMWVGGEVEVVADDSKGFYDAIYIVYGASLSAPSPSSSPNDGRTDEITDSLVMPK